MDKPHLKRHYARELDALLARLDGPAPSLLLHVCCAPCSSAVLDRKSVV